DQRRLAAGRADAGDVEREGPLLDLLPDADAVQRPERVALQRDAGPQCGQVRRRLVHDDGDPRLGQQRGGGEAGGPRTDDPDVLHSAHGVSLGTDGSREPGTDTRANYIKPGTSRLTAARTAPGSCAQSSAVSRSTAVPGRWTTAASSPCAAASSRCAASDPAPNRHRKARADGRSARGWVPDR